RGTIDLGDHRLEHGRPGRHFGDLDAGSGTTGDGKQLIADALGDVVALQAAVGFADQVHLDVGDIGTSPQKIVAHEPVEVVRRGGSGVGLEVHYFRLLSDDSGQLAGNPRGLFEGCAFGHVDDDLELALVVERQHLHLDEADADES